MKILTKEEAKEAMKKDRISHRLFASHEYIYAFNDGAIFTEDGFEIKSERFWGSRTSKIWDTGWFVYE